MNWEDTYINNELDEKIVSLIKENIKNHLEVNPNDNEDFLVERDVPSDVYQESIFNYYPTQNDIDELLGPDDSAEYEANLRYITDANIEYDSSSGEQEDWYYEGRDVGENIAIYMGNRSPILVQDAITEYKKDEEIVKTVKMKDGREINFVNPFSEFKDKNSKTKSINQMSDKELKQFRKKLNKGNDYQGFRR